MRRLAEYVTFLSIAAALMIGIFLIRPINETASISQRRGTEITKVYLGRTLNVGNGQILTQSFTVAEMGSMSAVGVYFPILNSDAKGTVKFELIKDAGGEDAVLTTDKTAISRLSNNEGLSIWRFRPLKVKPGERFTIKFTVDGEQGMTVFMGPGDAYQGGSLSVDENLLDVDLAFQVYHQLSPTGFWRLLSAEDAPNLIGPATLAAALPALWFALALWLWGLYHASTAMLRSTDG